MRGIAWLSVIVAVILHTVACAPAVRVPVVAPDTGSRSTQSRADTHAVDTFQPAQLVDTIESGLDETVVDGDTAVEEIDVVAKDIVAAPDPCTPKSCGKEPCALVAIDVAVGRYHSCAVLSDGRVKCWGLAGRGALGHQVADNWGFGMEHVMPLPVEVTGLTNVKAIRAGDEHTCALKCDQTVVCWGLWHHYEDSVAPGKPDTSPTQIAGLKATAIAAGPSNTCAVTTSGTVKCWGTFNMTFPGTPLSLSDAVTPVTVPGVAGAVAVAVGESHLCALVGGGGLVCAGRNNHGQLGAGPIASLYSVVNVPATIPFVAVAASGSGTLAVDAAGKAWHWGYTAALPLESGGGVYPAESPTLVPGLSGAVGVAAAGNVFIWRGDGSFVGLGMNQISTLGIGQPSSYIQVPAEVAGVIVDRVSTYGFHSCALAKNGKVWCWGSNAYGQLGTGHHPLALEPRLVPYGPKAVTAVAYGAHACALLTDGHVACWGENKYKSLGLGNDFWYDTPTVLPSLDQVVALDAGHSNACATRADGSLWCWGAGLELPGEPISFFYPKPTKIDGIPPVQQAAIGMSRICARTTAGKVFCWGTALGTGSSKAEFQKPNEVAPLPPAVDIAIAGQQVLVATNQGLWTWPDISLPSTTIQKPIPWPGVGPVAAVAASAYNVCVVLGGGMVKCWMKLSNFSPMEAIPSAGALVGGQPAVDIVMIGDYYHPVACALLGDASTWCWGQPWTSGATGDGALHPFNYIGLPAKVEELGKSVALHAGWNRVCAVATDGKIRCWGCCGAALGDGHGIEEFPAPVVGLF